MDCQANESYVPWCKLKSKVNNSFSNKIEVIVVLHQGSVLSLLLFVIVMGALCVGCAWELLYPDDLVIMSDNLEDLKIQLQAWKTSLATWGQD